MKIEKINNDKIRIFFNIKDLEENNIDFHSFMSNSIYSQKIFLHILDEAEKTLGFVTQNCKILLETLSIPDNSFVLTITKINFKKQKKYEYIDNKNNNITFYAFESIDYFCDFINSLPEDLINHIDNFSNKISLYLYENAYYLIIEDINLSSTFLDSFILKISEFSELINSLSLKDNIIEDGLLIFKNNAIKDCFKYFIKKFK